MPVAAALLAGNLPKSAAVPEPEKPSWGAAVCVALLLLGMAITSPVLDAYNPLLGTIRSNHRDEDDLAVVAAKLADPEAAGPKRIFSRFEWGEYLGWALQPSGGQIFMDARIEIYPDDVWEEYSAVTQGRADWQEILDAHGVDYLLLDTTYHEKGLLPQVKQAQSRWQEVYSSGKAVLFVRRESPAVAAAGPGPSVR